MRLVTVLLLATAMFAACSNPTAFTENHSSLTFSPCPAGTACVIEPLGDSITYGDGSSPGSGYRVGLWHDAESADNLRISFVGTVSSPGPSTADGIPFPLNSEGHSGAMVSDLMTTYSAVATATRLAPNIITLMAGTNDVTYDRYDTSPAQEDQLVGQLLAALPGAQVGWISNWTQGRVYFLAATRSGGVVRTYLNGALVGSMSDAGVYSWSQLGVGYFAAPSKHRVAEFALFGSALSVADITGLWNAGH